MPLKDRAYWEAGRSPCWSGERWLDAEHHLMMKLAYRRVFPDLPWRCHVLDIGCGDGRFTQWVEQTFHCVVIGVDAVEYPDVTGRIRYERCEAESVHEQFGIRAFDLAIFSNSLTCEADPQAAVASACKVAPRVMVFDHFMSPTPAWWQNVPHRTAVPYPELLRMFAGNGFVAKKSVAADYFHRKLFLKTPRWVHPATAVVSAVLDGVAAFTLKPENARHACVLFET